MSNEVICNDKSVVSWRIEYDEFALNPRKEYDPAGTLWAWHRRYDFADKGCPSDPVSEDEIRKLVGQHGVYLPVYMFEHSGIRLSTSPFSCPWDSGQIGWIFMKREDIKEEGWTKKQAEKYLEGEINELDLYVSGEVYGFKIFVDDELVDSCYGYFGRENAEMAAREESQYYIREHSRQGDLFHE